MKRGGSLEASRPYTRDAEICSVCGDVGRLTRGLCSAHYHRLCRHGNSEAGQRARPKAGEPLAYLLANMQSGCSTPWPFGTTGGGAGKVYAHLKIDGVDKMAHRYVCELAHGPPPTSDHEAAHSCNNRLCFNADCLRWATTVDNNADKLAHGTHNRGERHSMVKLTEDDVRSIRGQQGRTPAVDLADSFGISKWHVWAIQRRDAWSWLD